MFLDAYELDYLKVRNNLMIQNNKDNDDDNNDNEDDV